MTALAARLAHLTLVVRIERMRRHVRALVEQRNMQLPNLAALAAEFDKLRVEVEDDARRIIDNDIPAVRARKQNTFDAVKKKVAAIGSQVAEIGAFFDALDKATNGPPTSNASPPQPVSAQPAEAAALNQGSAG